MRPVLHADVVAAARCLLAVPKAARKPLILRLIVRAGLGGVYQRASGRAHPVWGNGCLETAASIYRQVPEPFLDDPDYCACMVEVFEAIIRARRREAGVQICLSGL